MLRGMSARQLADWAAFYENEPRGDKRGDWQAASICAMLLNAAELSRSGKTAMRFRPEQFLLGFDKPTRVKEGTKKATPKSNASHLKMAARMWASAMNAEVKRDAKKRKRR